MAATYEVTVQRDRDSQPERLAQFDDALEAWWGFVKLLGEHGCMAGPTAMAYFSNQFDNGEGVFCNGFYLNSLKVCSTHSVIHAGQDCK